MSPVHQAVLRLADSAVAVSRLTRETESPSSRAIWLIVNRPSAWARRGASSRISALPKPRQRAAMDVIEATLAQQGR